MAFMFENLDVYKKAVDFVVGTQKLCRSIKDRYIKDQLSRAALSIPLNIAEGNGRNTNKEKSQFYKTARGSLFECVPLLSICQRLQIISNEDYGQLYDMSESIGKMLNGLIN